MDSSSEGSFAWTNASDDSTDNEDMAIPNQNLPQSSEESESGKTYKKKLRKHLFSDSKDGTSDHSEDNQSKKRKLSQQESDVDNVQKHKKRVKAEPDSEAETPNKKKKSSHSQSSANDLYDESFLDSKVKGEQNSFVVPSPVKVKRNKKKSTSGTNNTISNGDLEQSELQSFSEPKRLSSSQIRFEDSSTQGSGLEEEKDENEYHTMKAKKTKKKSRRKSHSSEVNDVKVDDVQSDAGKENLQIDKISITRRQSSASVEELLDSPNPVQPEINTNRRSRRIQETMANNNTAQHNSTENPKKINSESLFNRRKSRMSERIQFEEEDDIDVETRRNSTSISLKPTHGKKLTSFIDDSSISFRPCTVKLPSSMILTDEDDVWLIRCPKDVKPEAFQDKNWVLDSKCKIKLDGQTYEGDIGDTESNITILSSKQDRMVVRNVKVNGCIRLRRRLPKLHLREDNIIVNNQTNFIPLPDTKCRHPLFGLNYKKAIKVPSRVVERLRASYTSASVSTPGKRKSKKERLTHHELDAPTLKMEHSDTPEEITQAIITAKKKKKKRKHSNIAQDEGAPQQKRAKKNLESAEIWDSEQAIEENLFNF